MFFIFRVFLQCRTCIWIWDKNIKRRSAGDLCNCNASSEPTSSFVCFSTFCSFAVALLVLKYAITTLRKMSPGQLRLGTYNVYVHGRYSHLDSHIYSLISLCGGAWRGRKLGIFIIKSDTKTNRQTETERWRERETQRGVRTAECECNIFAANDENVAWSPWATSFIIRLIASAYTACQLYAYAFNPARNAEMQVAAN